MDSLVAFPLLICGDLLACLMSDARVVEVGWTTDALQSVDTNVCGEYSLLFPCAIDKSWACNSAVDNLPRLGSNLHARNHALPSEVDDYSLAVYGHGVATSYGGRKVHIVPRTNEVF